MPYVKLNDVSEIQIGMRIKLSELYDLADDVIKDINNYQFIVKDKRGTTILISREDGQNTNRGTPEYSSGLFLINYLFWIDIPKLEPLIVKTTKSFNRLFYL